MAYPNCNHYWCQIDGHIYQIIHLPPNRQCYQKPREIKEEKTTPSLPQSKETLHTICHISIWHPWSWDTHVPEKNFPSPGKQMVIATLTSTELFPNSHECSHIHIHSPLSPMVAHSILQGDPFLSALWIWRHKRVPDKTQPCIKSNPQEWRTCCGGGV